MAPVASLERKQKQIPFLYFFLKPELNCSVARYNSYTCKDAVINNRTMGIVTLLLDPPLYQMSMTIVYPFNLTSSNKSNNLCMSLCNLC